MRGSLLALMNKLTWQLNDLVQELHSIDEQYTTLQTALLNTKQQVDNACSTPAIINPEQEIIRLNFIIQQQQKYEKLTIEIKAIESQRTQLQARQLRLNTELKMLEKYQERQSALTRQKLAGVEQHAIDEWVLQKRSRYENQ
ncbi:MULTISPECIES: hypothetical protein [unclassified Legionella]|uniref:hypothetical protein n=1 Tax=unclassified Legionella TaxID=2622702 RepID=UPI001054345F|nr:MULTISPECIES: hypothetical protein [unclassified Legionella]MDI9817552.1 hypothetical protein [Legionella sp. PL877]